MIFDEERVGDFVPLREERDQLKARVAELEAEATGARTALANADQALDTLFARVELLAAALKKVTDYFASAPALMSTGQWEALSDARAALAAGETESEA